MFPDAPSLLLEESLLQLTRADVPGTIAPLERMRKLDVAVFDARDPWPVYYLGTGRNAAALVAELWACR